LNYLNGSILKGTSKLYLKTRRNPHEGSIGLVLFLKSTRMLF
jgi:hypothetical protein